MKQPPKPERETTTPPRRIPTARKWLVFAAVAPGIFVTLLDEIGVNQAVPRIATHFNATIPDVQWIVLAYLLTVGALLLPIGRVADMIGHRKIYLAGVSIFALGGLLAGFSQSVLMLVLFKVMQGTGAAMIQATGLPIITSAFPTAQRGRAIGGFVGVLAMG
ncbi:MAG: MFS transporter, partial [Chloroflexi bacterium]|nr:MFS transporter [Chloroflexota bacterium]